MKRYHIKILYLVCMCLIYPLSASAEIDWHTKQTINLEKEPVDAVMSSRGTYLYVLTEDGIIHVYNPAGKPIRTIKLKKVPVDMVMSARGAYMYMLTDDGIIQIYDSAGRYQGQIEAGKNVDQIASGAEDKLLILTSKKNREVQTITVDFIKEINIKGSPFKGNADAPVVIVVFTDYQ
jgi:sugar lactone lactonase YvrE